MELRPSNHRNITRGKDPSRLLTVTNNIVGGANSEKSRKSGSMTASPVRQKSQRSGSYTGLRVQECSRQARPTTSGNSPHLRQESGNRHQERQRTSKSTSTSKNVKERQERQSVGVTQERQTASKTINDYRTTPTAADTRGTSTPQKTFDRRSPVGAPRRKIHGGEERLHHQSAEASIDVR